MFAEVQSVSKAAKLVPIVQRGFQPEEGLKWKVGPIVPQRPTNPQRWPQVLQDQVELGSLQPIQRELLPLWKGLQVPHWPNWPLLHGIFVLFQGPRPVPKSEQGRSSGRMSPARV